jgi:hypothetical protein
MHSVRLLLGCTLALALAGCAGYKLGPTGDRVAGSKSIQVNFFQNKTTEPRVIEAVTGALRKNLQQDGTFKLNTSNEGDIVVNGVITGFNRLEISFQPNDVLTVRDYQVTLTAKITARERDSGKVLLDRDVIGTTTVRVGLDLPSAERQAIPILADDLAKRATSLLVDGTW